MLRYFLAFALFLALISSLNANAFEAFDKNFANASRVGKIKIYNDLKGVYIKSVMNGKDADKNKALIRLIKASKALSLDYSNYEKELNQKKPKAQTQSKIKNNEKSVFTNTKTQSKQKINIISISSNENELKFKLSAPLNKNNIKSFELKDNKSYRKVYDINAFLNIKIPNFNQKISPSLRIAQQSQNKVRVVFQAEKKINISFNLKQNELIFKNEEKINKAKQAEQKNINEEDENLTKYENLANNQNQQNAPNKQERAKKIIVIDPGHGGKDGGALSNDKKLKQKDIVLNISKKLASILKNRGYKVYYTRSSDKFVNLRTRTSFANEKNANLFISIHANAVANEKSAKITSGIETFFLSPTRSKRSMDAANLENKADTDEMNYFSKISFLNFLNREKIISSNKLAIDLQSGMLKSVKTNYKINDGGVREAPFWVLVGALMPAALIEVGYISHPKESKLIANDKYQQALAKGIADGIDAYFAKNP